MTLYHTQLISDAKQVAEAIREYDVELTISEWSLTLISRAIHCSLANSDLDDEKRGMLVGVKCTLGGF